jgi:hypothetical protein
LERPASENWDGVSERSSREGDRGRRCSQDPKDRGGETRLAGPGAPRAGDCRLTRRCAKDNRSRCPSRSREGNVRRHRISRPHPSERLCDAART